MTGIITRVTFGFLPEQTALFLAKRGRVPSPYEIDELKGPVLEVGIVHTPAPGCPVLQIAPAVAMIDTGADRSHIEIEIVEEAIRATRQALNPAVPFSPMQRWTVRSGGWESDEFAIAVNGAAVRTRTGRIALTRRKRMPGYERVLIGRDLLGTMALCCSVDTFSLIDPPPIPIRIPNDPCCR
jgi:hypothetical protein